MSDPLGRMRRSVIGLRGEWSRMYSMSASTKTGPFSSMCWAPNSMLFWNRVCTEATE